MKLALTVNGTGSTLYLGLGFIPSKVKITNVEAATLEVIDWSEGFRATTTCAQGIMTKATTDIDREALTAGNGVEPYYGGDLISTASTAYQVPAFMVDGYDADMRTKGTLGIIDAWTLDTSANRTGKFNAGCNTSYVGVGSMIWIRPKREGKLYVSRIVALSNDGDADDEVTLTEAVASGAIERISYMYGFYNAPAGKVMPEGIIIKETGECNVSNETMLIEAEA